MLNIFDETLRCIPVQLRCMRYEECTVYVQWPISCKYLEHLHCIFSCDQAALRTAISICLSVRLSVCLSVIPFWQCYCNHIIMKYLEVIGNDRSDVHAKGQGQRSKVKVTEVMTPFSRFRTVTPIWIRIWWWNDVYRLMLIRRGVL